ncbi:target of SBF [Ophidiomyces ophidiicola]|nr:target of SBF [Ophidiomyces ophidiicola]KAI1957498.1 target of SBF [Ophidiomyces ophidiicola]
MDSSPTPRAHTRLPSVAGVKRSASLLPPFEPSSSPGLPRPVKRFAHDGKDGVSKYPTPVPTSSAAVPASSPPRARRGLKRTYSMAERAPLSTLPVIMLSGDGEVVTMGRSSTSCNYQLSTNRLVSRCHVQAVYIEAKLPFIPDAVEVLCTGWNGLKLYCGGKTYTLKKGQRFVTETRDADILIDVHDSRVLVQWPRLPIKDSTSTHSDQTWEDDSPTKNLQAEPHMGQATSPSKSNQGLASPISPSPVVQGLSDLITPVTPSRSLPNEVVVYEDEPSPVARRSSAENSTFEKKQLASQPLGNAQRNSLSSSLSKSEDLSEHDEENDPIVFSFGPFGANILPRMASFHTGESPGKSTEKPKPPNTLSSPKKNPELDSIKDIVQNHVINQLAFSRLSSTPLSVIIKNLPADVVGKLPTERSHFQISQLTSVVENTPCIGKVSREGKDAAGKALESEYYYIPDGDQDEQRREAVVNGLRKPGLRSCRKQHKQYYWRKPKTP